MAESKKKTPCPTHFIFLAMIFVSVCWLGFSYLEVDLGNMGSREEPDVSEHEELVDTETRINARLDVIQSGFNSKITDIKTSLSAIAKSIAALRSPENEPSQPDHLVEKSISNVKSAPLVDFSGFEGEYGVDDCAKQESVFFLKTSKTGSTTISNILTRFGYAHSKTFLLGEQANGGIWFINSYLPFSEDVCFLGRDIPNRPRIDISACHIRYNKTAIDAVLQPNNRKISILRNPHDNFISTWKYYHGLIIDLRKRLKSYNEENPNWMAEISEFLQDPWEHLTHFDYSHSVYLFMVNPQFVFFGLPSYLLEDHSIRGRQLVEAWINDINSDFAVMLILEDLDTSLAVLVLKFCWEVRDVVHLKLNTMNKDGNELSKTDVAKLNAFLWADQRLYGYFKRKLEKQVMHLGKKKVERVKAQIIAESNRLSEECLVPDHHDNNNNWIKSIKSKPEKTFNQTCYMLTQQEQIVSHLAIEQMIRWKKQYPEWRGEQNPQAPGNDVPKFCYDPHYAKSYHLALGKTEKQVGWGYWDFVRQRTNQYDVKQNPSPEIAEILKKYKDDPDIFRKNNFIYNDPEKPKAPDIVLDPSLRKG